MNWERNFARVKNLINDMEWFDEATQVQWGKLIELIQEYETLAAIATVIWSGTTADVTRADIQTALKNVL